MIIVVTAILFFFFHNKYYQQVFLDEFLYRLFISMNHLFVYLMAISIYCYLIKYKTNQKDLLPFYFAINELKTFYIHNIL